MVARCLAADPRHANRRGNTKKPGFEVLPQRHFWIGAGVIAGFTQFREFRTERRKFKTQWRSTSNSSGGCRTPPRFEPPSLINQYVTRNPPLGIEQHSRSVLNFPYFSPLNFELSKLTRTGARPCGSASSI